MARDLSSSYQGKYRCQFKTRAFSSLCYSLNGNTLASGSWDGTIKIWDADTGECLKTFKDKPYEHMNITGIKGLTRAEKASLKALGAVGD